MSKNNRIHLLVGTIWSNSLSRSGAASVVVKAANISLGMLTAVVMARALGANNYGVYAYVYAVVSLIAIPSKFGLPTLVLRETAVAEASHNWALMSAVWRWSAIIVLTSSVILMILAVLYVSIFKLHYSEITFKTFVWGIFLIPVMAMAALRGAALRGLRKVIKGQLPEQLVQPVVLIFAVGVVSVASPTKQTAVFGMQMHVFSAAVAFVVGMWLLRREMPIQLKSVFRVVYKTREWIKYALPLAMISGVSILYQRIDIVILGIYEPPAQVGIYRVAALGATVITIGLEAIGEVTKPYFVRYYINKKLDKLQGMVTKAALAAFLLATPICLIYVLFGGRILSIFFGNEYAAGYVPLVILSITHLVRTSFGSLTRLLNMTGHERSTLKCVLLAAGINIMLDFMLIPRLGMNGAAIATCISYVILCITLDYLARTQTGVKCFIFASNK